MEFCNIYHTRTDGLETMRFTFCCCLTGLKRKKEDTFGMKDEDWNVYKAIVSSLQLSSIV